MKVDIETKYNVGDILFYVNYSGEIEKKIIEKVVTVSVEYGTDIRYEFDDGGIAWETNMTGYASSIDGAGQIIAQRAIKKFNGEKG